jgi:hypothetical protein
MGQVASQSFIELLVSKRNWEKAMQALIISSCIIALYFYLREVLPACLFTCGTPAFK